jgi:hypothetical protein
MQTISYKLVKEENQGHGRKRYFECSLPIKRGCATGYFIPIQETAEEILENARNGLKPERRRLIPDEIKLICVSDAHTHAEKLIFFAFKDGEEYIFVARASQLAGRNTFMIDGFNQEVEDEEDLLKQLAEANDYKYGGYK